MYMKKKGKKKKEKRKKERSTKTCRNCIMFNAKLHWTQAVSKKKNAIFLDVKTSLNWKYQIITFTRDNNFKLLYTHFA